MFVESFSDTHGLLNRKSNFASPVSVVILTDALIEHLFAKIVTDHCASS
jgi:hypothetical protein